MIGIEKIAEAPGIATGTVVAWNVTTNAIYTTPNNAGGVNGSSGAAGTANSRTARLGGANIVVVGGGMFFGNSSTPFAANPELNGGALVFPNFFGSTVASSTGVIGTRLDGYYAYFGSTVVDGQTLDDVAQNERVIVLGPILQPWNPASGLTTT